MAVQPPLTAGVLLRVVSMPVTQEHNKIAAQAVLQVLELKPVVPKDLSKPRRFRFQVSDGMHQTGLMTPTQAIELVDNGTIKKGSFVLVEDFIANEVNGKMILIATNLTPMPQYGVYEQPIILAPSGVLDDVALHAPPPQAAPPNGAYGGPPPAANGTYGAPPPSMYGGPPPSANNNGYNQQPYNQPYQQQQQPGGYQQSGPAQNTGGYGAPAPAGNYGQPGGAYGGPSGNPSAPASGPGGFQQQSGPYGGGSGAYGGGGGGGAYGGPGPASRPAPQYNTQGGGPVVRDEAPPRITPINQLNPYTARWVIRGRCTTKGELRRFANARGEGKVFSFDLLDRDGGEIRVTSFGAEADKFHELVQVGHIFMVSKASLQQKRAQYNNTNHQYEIKLDRGSVVEQCAEDNETAAIPSIQFNFKKIAEIETTEPGAMVDIVGVVESCEAWQLITRKTGEETRKRSLVVRDDSNRSVEMTLWGEFVNEPGNRLEQMVRDGTRPVVAAKCLRVGDFNGKNLSTIGTSIVKVDPEGVQEANTIRQWYDSGGQAQQANSLSGRGSGAGGTGGKSDRRTTFTAIKDERLGMNGKPDWVTVQGTIDFIKQDPSMIYPACPKDFNNRPCSKKMMDLGGGQWSCERCNATTSEPAWRYMTSMKAADHTGCSWLTAFGEAGDAIFGMPASEVHRLELEDANEVGRLASDTNLTQMVFRLKVAEDTYNDEVRVKVSIYRVEKLTNWVKEGQVLLDYIRKVEAGQPVLQASAPEAQQQQQQRGAYGGAGPSNGYGGGAPGVTPPRGGGGGPGGPYGYGGGAPGGNTQYGGAPQAGAVTPPQHLQGSGPGVPPHSGGPYGGGPPQQQQNGYGGAYGQPPAYQGYGGGGPGPGPGPGPAANGGPYGGGGPHNGGGVQQQQYNQGPPANGGYGMPPPYQQQQQQHGGPAPQYGGGQPQQQYGQAVPPGGLW